MMLIILISVLFLAWVNGANDNFKGVATLLGAGVTDYRRALAWGTLATGLGGIAAVWLGQDLLSRFTGRSLLAQPAWQMSTLVVVAGLAAATTVAMATRLGMPVSTTHAFIGGLIGAGLTRASHLQWGELVRAFLLPLLLSPILAMIITLSLYPLFRWGRHRLGIIKQSCVCVGKSSVELLPAEAAALVRTVPLEIRVASTSQCREIYAGRLLGLPAEKVLTALHYLSAGLVSFARGWNDTPKIAALLIISPVFQARPSLALLIVAGVMAAGGWLMAERVAETLSHKITPMNAGQGFTANLTASSLVLLASWYGLPVSTTHVSGGSLFGLACLTGRGQPGIIASIILSWMFTLPVAMTCSFCMGVAWSCLCG